WSSRFGPTCLFGTVRTSHKTGRIALFDLDQTLILTNSGFRFPQDENDWKWFSSKVPIKLKQLHAEGYAIFIISNQNSPRKITTPQVYYAQWKNKVALVAHALQDVPFRILAATAEDAYRKPLPGMWDAINIILKDEGVTINQEETFFVGDAAGRDRDHSACDRKLAVNVGLQFYTPEEYFLGKATDKFQLKGFNPSSIRQHPHYLPSQYPLVPSTKAGPVMVLFVGFPKMGKTTTYNEYFKPAGFVYVDQQALGTKSKCMKLIEDSVKDGKSVVVDNSNHDKSTRMDYTDFASGLKLPVRCIVFDGGIDLSWHNQVYQAFIKEPVDGTEVSARHLEALQDFKTSYEPPTASEKFKLKIITIFWKFKGSDEEFKRYMMWLDF
ncbi:hypothetical protein M408DRAFT_82801, partial [Serendipita vermifera MAFF 305830]